MAAGKWKIYNSAKEYIGAGVINLSDHSFKVALFTADSNADTLTLATLSQVTDEVANGNGYTTGGEDLDNVSWGQTGGVATLTADPVQWEASGGSIKAKHAVIYRAGTEGAATDALLATCLLTTDPGEVEVTDGNTLTITPGVAGIVTLAGATSD